MDNRCTFQSGLAGKKNSIVELRKARKNYENPMSIMTRFESSGKFEDLQISNDSRMG